MEKSEKNSEIRFNRKLGISSNKNVCTTNHHNKKTIVFVIVLIFLL